MKKWILIIGGIILIGIIGIGIKINSDLNDVVEAFNSEHSLTEPNLIILSDSISPNEKYKFYEYQFDKGGLGYSRIFLESGVNLCNSFLTHNLINELKVFISSKKINKSGSFKITNSIKKVLNRKSEVNNVNLLGDYLKSYSIK